ncbi:AlpA family phage regulatory protein [Vibrio parahaemolyticus]|nr:AlpA family phage regulatory protein [Vibrio parahaemolyticus]
MNQSVPERLINIKEMLSLINKARPTLYTMVKEGRFPEPLRAPSGRTLGWLPSQYQEWLSERQGGSNE